MTDAPVPADVVASIPGAAGASWSRLASRSGAVWRVHRIFGPDVVVRVASDREVAAAAAAGAVDIGPAVFATPPGWLVVEHLKGRHVFSLELSRPTVLAELADLLARWHQAEVTLPEVPLAPARDAYRRGCPVGVLPDGLASAMARAAAAEAILERASTHRVPSHLDVVANVLATPAGLRLIDFEYAAAADPARELGQVAWEAELDAHGARQLIGSYGGAEVVEDDVAAWAWISGVTWTIWALSRPDAEQWHQYAARSWERVQRHWSHALV
ncbi:MAG: phosphotransferase [Actinomycetia bacterium]|nr:phosphotransferase [Actinomycetes bacterium]